MINTSRGPGNPGRHHRWPVVLTIFVAAIHVGMAEIELTGSGAEYRQDFDSLMTKPGFFTPWANDSTLPGWYVSDPSGAWNVFKLGIKSFDPTSDGPHRAELVNAGDGSHADRALGGTGRTGSDQATEMHLGVRLKNLTGKQIEAVEIAWVMEQWRDGGHEGYRVPFAYAVAHEPADELDAGAWRDEPAGDLLPVQSRKKGNLDGNLPENQREYVVTLNGLSWNDGGSLTLRWTFPASLVIGSGHILALDDLKIRVLPSQ